MEEAFRQMLGAAFIALGDAAGPDALKRACSTVTTAINTDAVRDPYAKAALRTLVASCETPAPVSTIAELMAEIGEAIESLTPETPPADILSIIRVVDALDEALVRLGLAVADGVAA
jgi:hypothetical protein